VLFLACSLEVEVDHFVHLIEQLNDMKRSRSWNCHHLSAAAKVKSSPLLFNILYITKSNCTFPSSITRIRMFLEAAAEIRDAFSMSEVQVLQRFRRLFQPILTLSPSEIQPSEHMTLIDQLKEFALEKKITERISTYYDDSLERPHIIVTATEGGDPSDTVAALEAKFDQNEVHIFKSTTDYYHRGSRRKP